MRSKGRGTSSVTMSHKSVRFRKEDLDSARKPWWRAWLSLNAAQRPKQ